MLSPVAVRSGWIPAAICLAIAGSGVLYPQKAPARKFELKAQTPHLWELLDPAAKLEKVAGSFGFTEGPVWEERGGFLYVSDEEQNKIYRVFPDGRKETLVSMGDPDGSTLDKNRRFITTASVLRAIVEVQRDGKIRMLADRYDGKKFNSPNDIVLGPDGALYFTDPTLDLVKGEKQEIPYQGVYRLGNDGSVRLLTRDLAEPNGIAFSPDGKLLYVNDTRSREIRVYDFIDGELKNGRLFAKEGLGRGGPDGMKVDVQGNLWVTGPGGVWVFDPRGNHLGTIALVEQAANFAWGGADFSTLYFCGRSSIYRLNTKVKGFVPYIAYAKPGVR